MGDNKRGLLRYAQVKRWKTQKISSVNDTPITKFKNYAGPQINYFGTERILHRNSRMPYHKHANEIKSTAVAIRTQNDRKFKCGNVLNNRNMYLIFQSII